MNAIQRLSEQGQSVWLDFIDRRLLTSGELRRLVQRDGIRGVTSNPTIFQKAIAGSQDYDALIRDAAPSDSEEVVLERLMVRDVTAACDELRAVYDETDHRDGFVSIEVDPRVANDSGASVERAVRMFGAVQRPNVMVKLPGTRAGLIAIESCLAHGLNVNVTLLFSLSRYREVIEAYLRALEARAARGLPLDDVASVASFFVSRVDTAVDRALDALPNAIRGAAGDLRGQIGIANARLAYEEYQKLFRGPRWEALAAKGARPQRLLWASTATKDPAYDDLHYAEALVGKDTVDTMTRETLRTYLERGAPKERLVAERGSARGAVDALAPLSIDLERITETLEDEAVAAFTASYEKALKAIAEQRRAHRQHRAHP